MAQNKVLSIKKAVELINDGDNLTISGFAHSLAPIALVREIIRQGRKNLALTSMGECWAADLLSGAGCLPKVGRSNYMFEGCGGCMNFSRAVQQGDLEVEDYSHFGITSRLFASALGISYLPTKVMAGTDIVKKVTFDKDKSLVADCPFTGEQHLLVKAIEPDVAVIHASRADEEGNTQLFGMTSIIDEQARASKTVIVSVEEIVPTNVIAEKPELTLLPSFVVDAVVEIPYGAHPAGMFKYYNYDHDHIQNYWNQSRQEKSFKEYLEQYVLKPHNHWQYLEMIGIRKLMELRADPYLGY